MELKDLISTRRKELGYTLEEIAQKVGVSKATVQRWESGAIKNLRRDKIAKLAKAMEVTPAYLMGWEEPKRETSPGDNRKAIRHPKVNNAEIKDKASRLKDSIMASISMAFDGKVEDEETAAKIRAILEETFYQAQEEAKEKYTPKKYKK